MLRRWRSYLLEPVDAASIAVFRIVLGAMVAWDAVRYLVSDWVDEYYIRPKFHFTYLFFDFVQPWPGQWMYVHFVALVVLAVLVSVGLFYRVTVRPPLPRVHLRLPAREVGVHEPLLPDRAALLPASS